MSAPEQTMAWWSDGERALGTVLGRLTDHEFDAPSRLPDWTRQTLLAHLARNADALVNLLVWARTGFETPMYSSPDERETQIAESARQSPDDLRMDVLSATHRLATAVQELPADAWSTEVRTAQGRTVPASEVPWMRCREVWVHAVDLDAGFGFEDVPPEVLAALVDDVFRMWDRRDQVPDVAVFAGDLEWGTGALAVAGTLPAVTAWLTGRSDGADLQADGPLPPVHPWL